LNLFKAPSLELDAPAGWRDRSTYVLTGPSTAGFSCSVVATMEHNVIDQYLKRHVDIQLRAMQDKLPAFVVTQRREVVSDRFKHGEAVDFQWTSAEVGASLHQHQLYALEAGTLFTVTATALTSYWPEHREMLQAIVASFQPRDWRPAD
jgi:hypothetical protein